MVETLTVGAAIVAVTEALKRILPDNIEAPILIAVAGILGLIAGYLGIQGLTPETGVVTGLAASGVYKLGSVISSK